MIFRKRTDHEESFPPQLFDVRCSSRWRAAAFRSDPTWAAPGEAPAVVPNYSALSDCRNGLRSMIKVEAEA